MKSSLLFLSAGTLCAATPKPNKIFVDPSQMGQTDWQGLDLGSMDLAQLQTLAAQGQDEGVHVQRWLAEQEPAQFGGVGPLLEPGSYAFVWLADGSVTSAASVPRVLHENVSKLPKTHTAFAVAIRDADGLEKMALIPALTWMDEVSFNCSVTVYDRKDQSVSRVRALTVRGEPMTQGAAAAFRAQQRPVRALLIVDMQYDFMEGGSLEVPNSMAVLSNINELRSKYESAFELVVCSQDWHPADHSSFLSNNQARLPDAKMFDLVQLESGEQQVMWPDHCVQGSHGAELHADLLKKDTDKIVRKGTNTAVDSYSAFMDNDKKSKTALEALLREHGVTEIYSVGLAYDYCVGWTAIDGASLGFKSFIVKDCSAGIAESSIAEREAEMLQAGVSIINLADIAALD